MVNKALGGAQAVQDFLVHLDMSVQTDDGLVSYYEEVLDAAVEGAADHVPLDGGFTFSAVDSLHGHMVDPDGQDLPSLAVDFGLLAMSPEGFESSRSVLVESLIAAGETKAGAALADAGGPGSPLLVELVTADFGRSRTHAAPGDRAAVDLTFVEAIAPGDTVTSLYLFGQSHPGDPDAEVGLSADQLFSYRWNLGLISLLGSEEGPSVVTDAAVDVVEGSTVRLQEIKAGIAVGLGAFAALRAGLEVYRRKSAAVAELNRYLAEILGDEYLRWNPQTEVVLQTVALVVCAAAWFAMFAANQAAAGAKPSDKPPMQPRFCVPTDPPARSVGGTFGDVHVTTFDGLSYDNQAAGEFLVFDNGVAAVQMRLEPWEDSDAVSVVTAAAVGVGDHEVAMYQGSRIWIDGVERDLVRGESIGVGDAALLWTGGGWFIVWPDGTEVRVTGGLPEPYADPATPNYSSLVVLVHPSDLPVVGMFGSPDGNGPNDWVTRGGEQLDYGIFADFDNFYPTYIDTWRISQEESFFHYEPGESTESYTVTGFPRARRGLADLDPDAVADAEAACIEGGIERPEILQACTFDVAVTGDYRFVFDAYIVESSTAGKAEPAPQPVVDSPIADGDNVVTVGPLSVGFGPEPPTVLPNSNVQWECQATQGSLFATGRFLESADRWYKISIQYLDAATSRTGDEEFSLIVEQNDEPVAWINNWVDPMPGSLNSIELTGSALTVSGTAFLNQPPNPALLPGSVLAPGTLFEPFALKVNCAA